MKAIIQRVIKASVEVDRKLINKIDKGLCILIGFEKDDTEEKLQKMVKKIANMRLFEEKFSKSVSELSITNEIGYIKTFSFLYFLSFSCK